jgi:uncharacterized membrane protein
MSPPSIPRTWKVGLAAFYVTFFLYAVIILASPLVGVVVPALLIGLWYLAWRAWRVFRMHEEKLEDETQRDNEPSADPVEQLKQRYAAGELTEEEFERELERLLEKEERGVGETDQSAETLTEKE